MTTFRNIFLTVLAVAFQLTCLADNPNGYYNSINGKKKEALKTALSNLLYNHTVQEYSSIWTFFQSTDKKPDGTIWDMYSSNARTSTWGMNREHSFPKSWWGGDVNEAYTDMNHIYPADADANEAKSNYPLGEVGNASFYNGVTKVGNNVFPGYSTNAFVFEPADEYKGDFARTYFYMATCYQNYNWRYTYMVDQNIYPTLKPWAVNMLLKWHRQDPVSDKERKRNEAVFKIQNNRNPFIDYPQLAEYIWGDSTNYVFSLDTVYTEPKLATPTNDTRLDFGAAISGTVKTRELYVKGSSLNSSLSVYLEPENDYLQFSVATDRITKDQANAGYKLTVSYKPKSAGSHQSSISLYDGGIEGSVKVCMTGVCIPLDSLVCPEPLAASDISATGFTANWKPARYADSYCINIYAIDGNMKTLIAKYDSIPENSLEVSGLGRERDYCYTIKSRIGSYLSGESSEMPVTILSSIVSASKVNSLTIYTASGKIYIQSETAGKILRIFNVSGMPVVKATTTGNVQEFNNLGCGTYIVECEGKVYKVIMF